MEYIIYKTTNTLNGKYYIGAHNGTKRSYKGSGVALQRAMKEHGRENFVREVLERFDTEEEMYAREAELVNEALVKDRNSYNIATGGKGGPGQPKSEAHKQAIRDNHLRKSNPGAGRKPKMDPKAFIELCDAKGKRKAAEDLGITLVACRSRYHYLKHVI